VDEMNTLMTDLKKLTVGDAMSEIQVTVAPTQKLEEVANLFQLHRFHSVPVVDSADKCIGIITSHDLVRYQSELSGVDSKLHHGMTFEMEQNTEDGESKLVSHPFDEVQRHMTSEIQTVKTSLPLVEAAKIMCHQKIHHLIVLDESQCPVGMLSSLDILARFQGC
jgi:CBS domain-containing protein